MRHEAILEDVLRNRAADVELDPGALAAILSAPAPSGASGQEDSKQPEQSERSESSSQTASASGATGAAGAQTGGSFVGGLVKGVAGFVGAAVVGALVYAGVAGGTGNHCPGLGWVNGEVNARIGAEGAGDQGVDIPCDADTLNFDDVKDATPPGLHGDLDANRDEIEAILECINETATPLSLVTIFDKIPDVCLRELG